MSFLRTFLTLGRVAGLPTIWSNCLAGWWLGGRGNVEKLPLLFLGATLLYLGGTFLNDAFDAGYDHQHRRSRPIPSGAASLAIVRGSGLGLLALGSICWLWLGSATGGFGLVLILCIFIFNAIHRLITFSSALLAICRVVLYVAAASTASNSVTGWSIWCGIALGAYIIGLEYFARRDRTPEPAQYWPALPLVVPVLLALIMDVGGYREGALLISAVLCLWLLRCLRYIWWSTERKAGLTASGLLAGVVLVDWLAAVDTPRQLGFVFLGLWGAALLLARLAPRG